MRRSQRDGPRSKARDDPPDVWCGGPVRGSVTQSHRGLTVPAPHPPPQAAVRPQLGPSTTHWASRRQTGSQTVENVSSQSLQLHFSDLLQKAQIIQTIGVSEDQLRFSLDPLAEYLAALYVVEYYGAQEYWWEGFIDSANNQPGSPEAIIGFLRAVHDCCVTRGSEHRVPTWVIDRLTRLTGLVPT